MKLELVAAAEALVATAPEAEPEAVPESPPVVVVSILLIVEVNSAPSSATMLFEELMPLTVTVFVVAAVCEKSLC